MPKLDPSLAGFTTKESSKLLISFSPDKKGEVCVFGVPAFFISTKYGV